MAKDFDLGNATSYSYYVSEGGTKSPEEFGEMLVNIDTVATRAEAAASGAAESEENADQSKTAAQAAAGTATTKAAEASQSATAAANAASAAQADADAAALDASQAMSAASTATSKASEAASSASTATTAKNDAVTAKVAAQAAQTAAETAEDNAETSATAAAASAASVAGSAAQIATNAEDITQLKSEFTALESDGVVPSAEQILSDKGVTDSVPYHYRKTGGDGADRLCEQIVGGTVCFNQLVQNGDFSDGSTGWGITNTATQINSTESKILTMDCTAVNSGIRTSTSYIKDHKYLKTVDVKSTAIVRFDIDGAFAKTSLGSGDWETLADVFNYNYNSNTFYLYIRLKSNATVFGEVQARNAMLIDLTAMFGSTIADHIYSLEQTTAGSGVAFFKSLFPNDYYPYNAGELMSVSGLSEHKMVGFNQWDEEWEVGGIDNGTGQPTSNPSMIRSKNFIKVLPNTTYYFKTQFSYTYVYMYDEDMNFIALGAPDASTKLLTLGGNVHYIKFRSTSGYTTYNHDICINLSDPAKNGTYEPYESHSYPLDSTLTLRGLFKLDANNKLYADGDTYDADGTVTRNTIFRAYQSGDESLANAITDGTNTVVYSANASTEQADPYQHLQQCDHNGTEEYVSTGIVPVGHNSFYPENLRAKVEQLPWNFASLIAPTESTFTATRNYTTGSLFIVDNVLYKATANIANGGTITPNTNCTATTLAEIISALA